MTAPFFNSSVPSTASAPLTGPSQTSSPTSPPTTRSRRSRCNPPEHCSTGNTRKTLQFSSSFQQKPFFRAKNFYRRNIWALIFSWDGNLFRFIIKHVHSTTVGRPENCNLLIAHIQYIGPDSMASKYAYQVRWLTFPKFKTVYRIFVPKYLFSRHYFLSR